MKIAKYLLTNILLSTVILLLLGSCDKKSETPSPSSVDSEAQAVELSFESIIGDNPKGLTFAQNNPSKPVVPENGVNVLLEVLGMKKTKKSEYLPKTLKP